MLDWNLRKKPEAANIDNGDDYISLMVTAMLHGAKAVVLRHV